jgi:hypothetical protein
MKIMRAGHIEDQVKRNKHAADHEKTSYFSAINLWSFRLDCVRCEVGWRRQKRKRLTSPAGPLKSLSPPVRGQTGRRGRTGQSLTVAPASEDSNLLVFYFIDKTMFGIDSPGPASDEFMFQGLGFTDSDKRVALNFSDNLNDSKGLFSILFNPPARSSKAAVSNSKLFSDFVKRDTLFSVLSLD